MQLKSLLSRAVDNLDVTLAALGCILAVPLTIYLQVAMRSPVFAVVGVIVFVTCLAYLLIRRRRSALVQTHTEATPRIYLLLDILFFGLLTYSILAFYIRPEPYVRPLSYFISLAAMAAVLSVEIVFLPSHRRATPSALLKIIIIGLSVAWSQLLIYPTLVGHDPWFHKWFTVGILDAAHVPTGLFYSGIPGMHLATGSNSLITGLDYSMAAMLSISLVQIICNALLIFLLGRFIHSARAGLLAALALVIANYHMLYVYNIISLGMAVAFIPIIVYLLIKVRQDSPGASIFLASLLMLALLITHSLAAVMLGVVLLSLWLGLQIYRLLRYGSVAGARVFPVTISMFAVATLSYWTLVSGHIRTLVFLTGIGFGGEVFDRPPPHLIVSPPSGVDLPPFPEAVIQYLEYSVPYAERLFDQLGFFLFFALAFIGALVLFSRGMRERWRFAFTTAGSLVLALTFVSIITYRGILEERWLHLSQILLAIPMGVGLLWLAGLQGRRAGSATLTGVIVFTLAFLMLLSPQLNLDNRGFSPNTILRFSLVRSELQAVHTVSTLYDGRLGVDGYNVRGFQLVLAPEHATYPIDDALYYRDYHALEDMLVLVREEIVSNPFRPAAGVFRLDHDPRQALEDHGFSRVYDSGSVGGFTRSGLSEDS